MIPAKAYDVITVPSAYARAKRDYPGTYYAITGTDLHDLAALVARFEQRIEGDELRDWQNRISLMVMNARRLMGRGEDDDGRKGEI